MKKTNKTIRYKGGGYVKIEKVKPWLTMLEMNGKGFWEMFGKEVWKAKSKKGK